MTEYDGDARLEARTYPLIVFVHVPKTAGSILSCKPSGFVLS
jgi:hypothetical protein